MEDELILVGVVNQPQRLDRNDPLLIHTALWEKMCLLWAKKTLTSVSIVFIHGIWYVLKKRQKDTKKAGRFDPLLRENLTNRKRPTNDWDLK